MIVSSFFAVRVEMSLDSMSKYRRALARFRIYLCDRLDRLGEAASEAVQERRIQVVLLATTALVSSNIAVVRITDTTLLQQFSGTTIALLITFLSVYVSFDIITPYLKFSERQRIADAAHVLESYEDSVFIDLETMLLDSVPRPHDASGLSPRSRVAAATEDVPDTLYSLDDLTYDYRDEMYEIPTDLWGVLEPAVDQIAEIFEREGYFSQLKLRADRVDDTEFQLSKTTYYRSFLTNFCPDLDLGSGRSLRTLTEQRLVAHGSVRPLPETPFSNHLGGAGLVVTADGVIAVSTRSGQVAVDKYAKSLSFSGSLDLEPVEKSRGLSEAVLQDMTEELNISRDDVRDTAYLGTTRRMERLGKPDIVCLVLVDGLETWENPTDEFTDLDVIDLEGISDLHSITDLLEEDVAEEILRAIFENLNRTTRHASIGLLSFVALYSRLVRIRAET
ncbi:MAG: hypothetical protein V5A62_13315 [Haloarculaceae archaeon]